MKTSFLCAVVVAMAVTPAISQESPEPSGWNYNAAFYGWLAGLEGTMGFGDQFQEPVDATFKDLAGYVDFAIAGRFEAINPQMAFFTDVAYTDLSSSREAEIRNQTVTVNMDITQWILEFGGGYRVKEEILILFAGRYYVLDTGATSTTIAGGKTGEAEQSWGDIYVGVRYKNLFREKWIVSIRGDIGAGGSELAWFGEATVGYRFTELISGLFGYRILSLDREPDSDGENYFKYDMVQNGFGIGLGFSF
jgi:hypothetical protein